MFVGGCVRNALMQAAPTDIDIATQYTPQEIIGILEEEGIKVIPTGIDHGTVKAVIHDDNYEITTLRKDVTTDGRRATIAFTNDWIEDAQRRDFTINTFLCDVSGNVYDPTGQGESHLKQRRIVFVGDPAKRIAEDYLRILRLFRFHAEYGEGAIDRESLQACEDAATNIESLSRERITQEFLKILASSQVVEALQVMFDHQILIDICGAHYSGYELKKLVNLQEKYDAVNLMTRLFIVSGDEPKFHDELLRLSHAQKNFLVKLEMVKTNDFFADKKSLKRAIFYHGNELLVQGYLLALAMGRAYEDSEMFDLALNWQAPECPINGEMLIAEGYQTGPDLGQELERRREEWLDEVLD
jgi:poly(A) polymerase